MQLQLLVRLIVSSILTRYLARDLQILHKSLWANYLQEFFCFRCGTRSSNHPQMQTHFLANCSDVLFFHKIGFLIRQGSGPSFRTDIKKVQILFYKGKSRSCVIVIFVICTKTKMSTLHLKVKVYKSSGAVVEYMVRS